MESTIHGADQVLAVAGVGVAVLIVLVVVVPPWRSVRRERRLQADETARILLRDEETE